MSTVAHLTYNEYLKLVVVVVVELFYCPYAQNICSSGDFRVKTDECIVNTSQ